MHNLPHQALSDAETDRKLGVVAAGSRIGVGYRCEINAKSQTPRPLF